MLGIYFRSKKESKGEVTAKDMVRKIHPTASCKFRTIHKAYIIFNDDKMSRGIGKGITPKKAWENAYKKLQNK